MRIIIFVSAAWSIFALVVAGPSPALASLIGSAFGYVLAQLVTRAARHRLNPYELPSVGVETSAAVSADWWRTMGPRGSSGSSGTGGYLSTEVRL